MNRMRPAALVVPLLLAAAALFMGCESEPPEITRTMGRLIMVHDLASSSFSEKLSVFVVGSDPDGNDDLSSLYVINDDAQLFWSVDSKSWTTATADGESWIGTNGLSMPETALFPAGEYRVVLQDAGGNTAESIFTLQGTEVNPSKIAYPSFSVKSGVIRFSGKYSDQELWVYSKDDKFIMRLSAGGASSGAPSAAPAGSPGGSAVPVGPAAGAQKAAPGDKSQPAGAAAGTPAAAQPVTPFSGPLTLEGIQAAYPGLAGGFIFWVYGYDQTDGYSLLSGPYSSTSLQPQ
jgi:hypothetical protein